MRPVSAPALRAAIEILREYKLELKPGKGAPGMTACDGHVAIVIDYATNVYKLVELRPELSWHQQQLSIHKAQAPQLAGYLKKLIEAMEQVPRYAKDEQPTMVSLNLPIEFQGHVPSIAALTKASVEAARFLNDYYLIAPIQAPDRLNAVRDLTRIAQLTEVNLGLAGAMEGLPLARLFLDRLKNGQATEKEIRICFRDLGVYLESMPNYKDRREEMRAVEAVTKDK
jgi:hypothetical protein